MSLYDVISEMKMKERCLRLVKEYGKFTVPPSLNRFTHYSEDDLKMDKKILARNRRDYLRFRKRIEDGGWNGG